MPKHNSLGRGKNQPSERIARAAQYVRMSTEHQRYSTANQEDAIARYAATRGLIICKTYSDDGKSGLRLDGRDALQQLIEDVQSRNVDFQTILVYDISRWGRFQDADESAHYEFICRNAGIAVQYCAEQFDNDGSISATLLKSVKRVMAGEYSRELSAKVFAGQCRLTQLGFRQGGSPGYGLRRQLIDEHRTPKALLQEGERKSLQADRVILVPGPPDEVAVVRRIYGMFAFEELRESEIAATLNSEGLTNHRGVPWTPTAVHRILVNEKYIGNNVYNRRSFKLKQVKVVNPPDKWVRTQGAFAAIVDFEAFSAARQIIEKRNRYFTDQELLEGLKRLLKVKGTLSSPIIDQTDSIPSSATYRQRFGALVRAYRLIGYVPSRDYRYIETNRALRTIYADLVADTVGRIKAFGGVIRQDPKTELFTVNGEFTVSIAIARAQTMSSGALRWKIRLDVGLSPDITVAVRMTASNGAVMDYYLLPRVDFGNARLQIAESNGVFLDAYRFDSLDNLAKLCSRTFLQEAA